jgi:hypothetical protein
MDEAHIHSYMKGRVERDIYQNEHDDNDDEFLVIPRSVSNLRLSR